MDKKTEALKLALEQLEVFSTTATFENEDDEVGSKVCCNEISYRPHAPNCKTVAAITAVKEALAEQPAEQEPVAWICKPTTELLWPDEIEVKDPSKHRAYKPLYTSPQPSKPWVGLTDEEIEAIDGVEMKYIGTGEYVIEGEYEFAKAIEAKLKEKNT